MLTTQFNVHHYLVSFKIDKNKSPVKKVMRPSNVEYHEMQ